MATEPLELGLVKVYDVFRTQYAFIRNGIKPFLGDLAPMLFARNLIDPDTNSTAVNPSIPTGDRVNTVMLVLDARIRAAPRDVYTLMEVLEEMPVLSAMTSRLHQLLRGQQQQTSSHLALVETNVALANFPPEPAAYVTVTGTLALPSSTLPLQMAHPMNPSLDEPPPPSRHELVEKNGMKAAAHKQVCSHVLSSTLHPAGPTHHPADPTLHPADPTLHPADPTLHPADPTLHPAGPTHYPVALRKRDLTGPRMETGRVAGQQFRPASGDIAQSHDSTFLDMDAHTLSPKASSELISVTTTTRPLSPTSPTSDHMLPTSPIDDYMSPTSPISDRISPASDSASVYPPPLQATLSATVILSRRNSIGSCHSTGSSDTFYSALSSLSLCDTEEP